jgi:hypothetical protein
MSKALTTTKATESRMTRYFTPNVVEELATLEADLGGRQSLVGMLVLAPLTPDLRYVLGMLGDPQHARHSLAQICAIGNILPGDLLQHLTSAAQLKGKVKAAQIIAARIGAVTDDVMRKSAPYEAPCNGGCRGTGSITPEPTKDQPNPQPGPCETCLGTGVLVYQPTLDHQKLAIEMAQLLPKGGNIQILNQQNNLNPQGGSGSIERLQALTDKILYGQGTPLDGETLPGAEPSGEPPEPPDRADQP